MKGENTMKKILFAIAIIMTMVLSASAQRDGFFSGYDSSYGDRMGNPNELGLGLPSSTIGEATNESAPLGTGLLIMTALGGAYLIRKREK